MKTVAETKGIIKIIDPLNLPFLPVRMFCVNAVQAGTVRGNHSHLETKQVLFCIDGRIEIKTKNGKVVLQPGDSFFIDANVWAQQTFLDDKSSLLVLCSTHYDPDDYIYS